MRSSLLAACEALGLDADRAVPVMVESPASAWNLEALWWSIHQALPAARQSQLERMARRRSLLDGVRDGVRTLPGVLRQGWRLFRKP
jgi:hypothetical protein